MSDEVDFEAFLDGFVAEAEEHLRTGRSALVRLDESAEAGRGDAKTVRELFRALHTVKGLAAMVGVQPVVEIAHRMESVLRRADQAGGVLPSAAVDPLMRGLGAIEAAVEQVSQSSAVAAPSPGLLEELERLEPGRPADTELRGVRLLLEPELASKLTTSERSQIAEGVRHGRRALRVSFAPSSERAAAGLDIGSVRQRLEGMGELVRVLPVSVPRSEEAPGGLSFTLLLLTDASNEVVDEALRLDPDGPSAVELSSLVEVIDELDADAPLRDEAGEPTLQANVVRVQVPRLDAAMQSLSSLVVNRFKLGRALAELRERGVDVRGAELVAEENARLLRDMRDAILRLRMIPVSELLERIPLIVRGLRSTTGKAVQVDLGGARAELDKSVAERVFPALVHLVRNAVDHGVEPPELRRAAHKPEEGQLTIWVDEPSGDHLEITVSDDGAGIDAAAVARRAGAPEPEDDERLLSLLIRPGMTTRDAATTTSGRGMGMDIVHRVIVRELGGDLSLHNRPGRGATFTLTIPLTVSIVDSLSFECGRQPFVVPLASVEEVLDLDEVELVRAPGPSRGSTMLERRGEVVPFVPLAELFDHDARGASAKKALLVRRHGRAFAFGVERMIGQQEVVVRPLLDPLVHVEGISGSTDLGDGRPTLVLDLAAFGRKLSAEPRVRV